MPVLPDALEIPGEKGVENLHVFVRGSLQMFFFLEVADHRDLQLTVDSLEETVRPPPARAFGKSEVKKEILFRECDDFFFHGSFAPADDQHFFENRPEFSGDRFRKERPPTFASKICFQAQSEYRTTRHFFFRFSLTTLAPRDGLHELLGIQYPSASRTGPSDIQQPRDLILANEGSQGY
jgi:hypothetical protein